MILYKSSIFEDAGTVWIHYHGEFQPKYYTHLSMSQFTTLISKKGKHLALLLETESVLAIRGVPPFPMYF